MHSGRRKSKSKSGAGNYLEQNNARDYNKIYYANMEELSMKNRMAKRVLCLLLSTAVLFGGVTECNAAALGETTEVAETEIAESEAVEIEETEVTEAVPTETTEAAGTEETEIAETEATETVETEETEAAETEATEAVETEETEAVESETTEIEATEVIETEETEISVTEEETFASLSDVEKNATVLSFGKKVTGKLTSCTAENWYKFSSKANGYFQINFSKNAAANVDDIDRGWDVYLYSDSNLTDCIKSYRGITDKQLSAYLPFGNRTCYIKVCANFNYSDGYAPTNCPYDLTVSFTGSDAWETEYNDANATANTISVNKNYSATLYQAKDVDWYKVNITERGYFKFNFIMNATSDETKYGWDVSVYDSSLNELKTYSALKSSFTSQALPFAKGTYYVKVCANFNYSDGYAPVDCVYKFNVSFAATDAWENEYNDTNATANTISANKNYSGTLYKSTDVDWYKVKITDKGYFRIKFTVDSLVNVDDIDRGWDVSVYDSSLNEIKTYSGITGSVSEPVLPYAPGTYYVKVCANYNYSDGYAPTDCLYKLNVVTKASSTWESEKNDTQKKATSMALNKTYSGIFTNSSDVDWYKINVKNPGVVKFTLAKDKNVSVDDVKDGWNVYVYNKAGDKVLDKMEGVKSSSSVKLTLKKGIYYIKVCAASSYSASYTPTQCVYKLSAMYSKTPAQVTLTSVKGGKKQETLNWKKASGATGYYVYRSTSKKGKYKKIATIKKASTLTYKDKKSLKSKKTYYYKVVAYRTENGVTATGKASAIKSAKTK